MSRVEDLDHLFELGLIGRAQWTVDRHGILRDLGMVGSLDRAEVELILPVFAQHLSTYVVTVRLSKSWTVYPDYRLVLDEGLTLQLNLWTSMSPYMMGLPDRVQGTCFSFIRMVDNLLRPHV